MGGLYRLLDATVESGASYPQSVRMLDVFFQPQLQAYLTLGVLAVMFTLFLLEVYPSRRDLPCFWFNDGARTCPKCDGTGEADG